MISNYVLHEFIAPKFTEDFIWAKQAVMNVTVTCNIASFIIIIGNFQAPRNRPQEQDLANFKSCWDSLGKFPIIIHQERDNKLFSGLKQKITLFDVNYKYLFSWIVKLIPDSIHEKSYQKSGPSNFMGILGWRYSVA